MSLTALSQGQEFLRISRRSLQQRFERIEACVARLSEEQIWFREYEAENAVGNLMLHLAGNVRQWIISGVAGADDHRDRDAEFRRREPMPAGELLAHLQSTLDEADMVLANLTDDELLEIRHIQRYDVTVLHAVHHVVEHFAEHTGQIIWATKHLTGKDLAFYGYLNKPSQAPPDREP